MEEEQILLLNVMETFFVSAVKDGSWSPTSMCEEEVSILGNAGSLIRDVTW